MWGNLGDRLAGLGDVLTQQASAHAKRQHEQQQQQQQQQQQTSSDPSSTSTSSSSKAVADGGTVVQLPPSPSEIPDAAAPSFGSRWANPLASLTSQPPPQPPSSPPADQPPQAPSAVLGSLRNWTGSVVSATNKLVETTRETLEKEQIRLQSSAPSLFSHSRRPYKRDVSLPLDVEALRDAEVVYITDRIVTLSHPFLQSTTDGDITPERKLAAVGHLLRKRHGGRYMIWNLSEVEYDADVLDDQVLVYKFPGSPSPPLGLLLKLLLSMESWLKADERNVAVIHCLTGRGRTSTVLAAFLCWTGEAGFSDVNVALEYIARCKRCAVETLTIPSQVRYVSYFANMLDGVRPSQPPLMLKRIIMSEAPKFGKRPLPTTETNDSSQESSERPPQPKNTHHSTEAILGCAPYLQIFKAGTLIFTTAASMNYTQTKDDLPFCTANDGPVSFLTESIVQGDILLRCRHLTRSGQRISMFRCAFHTGYVPPKVLRLTKAQLDGACGDKRFSDDFFLDLIFEHCDEATASRHLMANIGGGEEAKAGGESADAAVSSSHAAMDADEAANEAARRRSLGTVGAGHNSASASAYDSMLHRDSRFWDVIAKRREENRKKLAALEKMKEEGGTSDDANAEVGADADAALYGPTIGRIRDFSAAKQSHGEGEGGEGKGSTSDANSVKKRQNPMSAFSIGGDHDFGLDSPRKSTGGNENNSEEVLARPPSPLTPKPKQRDELMEALMGLEDDDDAHDHDIPPPPSMEGPETDGGPETEEIIFESEQEEEEANVAGSSVDASSDICTATSAEVHNIEDRSNDETTPAPSESAAPAPVAEDKPTTQKDESVTESSSTTLTENATIPTEAENATEENILADIAGFDSDLGDLNIGSTEGDDILGDDEGFYGFDDLEDDAELEDLENFLTQVSTK
mmetsp:Transcript_12434/g.26234  ORF Transcript_12434/g.26234 Transcript_12434/m.26234 type:complete len:916 (+) Transcript_12434:117-2864(+)